jgi:Spy/CpxP family protein refolding chaperone
MNFLLHRTRRFVLLVTLALAAGVAEAAPPPGMPDIGLPFGNYFAVIKAKLNLTAEQDAQYTVALRATQVAMEAARKARTASAVAVKAELSKADPDFAKILTLREDTVNATSAERKQANAEWIKFTQLLSTEQKALIKGQLLDRVSRAENMREKFRQRHGG